MVMILSLFFSPKTWVIIVVLIFLIQCAMVFFNEWVVAGSKNWPAGRS